VQSFWTNKQTDRQTKSEKCKNPIPVDEIGTMANIAPSTKQRKFPSFSIYQTSAGPSKMMTKFRDNPNTNVLYREQISNVVNNFNKAFNLIKRNFINLNDRHLI